MIQLYESYSTTFYEVSQFGLSPSAYLVKYIAEHVARGEQFYVQFEDDPAVNLPSHLVSIPLSKLVIGLANGWATNNGKSIFISPAECKIAYKKWTKASTVPRGFMFWTINEEGLNGVHMAEGLNQVLHIRNGNNGFHSSSFHVLPHLLH